MSYLLANWFYDKRGTMTGIAFTGSSLITSALSPVVTRLIAAYGWRTTYRILAVTIVIVVLISVLLIRTKPEDIGQRPLGTENKSEAEIKPTGFMRKDAMKKIWFWTYAIGVFLMGLVVSGTQQQLVAYWTSEGISAARAATILLSCYAGWIGSKNSSWRCIRPFWKFKVHYYLRGHLCSGICYPCHLPWKRKRLYTGYFIRNRVC